MAWTRRWRRSGSDRDHTVVNLAAGASMAELVPGEPHLVTIIVELDRPRAPGDADGFGMTVRWREGEDVHERTVTAINAVGAQRLELPFTPTAATVEVSVNPADDPAVHWDRPVVVAGSASTEPFDGDTDDDAFRTHTWIDASRAQRTLRPARQIAQQVDPSAAAEEITRLRLRGAAAEADFLDTALRDAWGGAGRRAWFEGALARSGGNPDAALEPLRTAARRLPREPHVHRDLGLALASKNVGTTRRWQAAREALEHAWALDEADLETGYALADVLSRLDEDDAATRIARDTRANDPRATAALDGAIAAGPRRLLARRTALTFVADHLDAIRRRADAFAPTSSPGSRPPVFVFWNSGFDDLPPIVQRCVESMQRNAAGAELILLDERNVGEYADWPIGARDRIGRWSHLTDLLRVDLLQRHGGIWADATCWFPAPFVDQLTDLSADGLFAFRHNDVRMSSWLLAAPPDSVLVRRLKAALWLWTEQHGVFADYIWFHLVCEALCRVDPESGAEWDRMPVRPSRPAHAIQRRRGKPVSAARFEQIAGSSLAHKLTYKVAPDSVARDSVFDRILRGEPH